MNQKLRTARSSIVILFALLCIVCLSLSLILSANFAAYAAESATTSESLKGKNDMGEYLWLYYYADNSEFEPKPLMNGAGLAYLDYLAGSDDIGMCYGAEEVNYFAPYCGHAISIKLNPAYHIDNDTTLGDKYNLDTATYSGNNGLVGQEGKSLLRTTTVTATDKGDGESLTITKEWKISTLCNTLVDAGAGYITNRAYAQNADMRLLRPTLGNTVVYDFVPDAGTPIRFAVKYDTLNGESYFDVSEDYEVYEVSFDLGVDTDLIADAGGILNHVVRSLSAGTYTLKVVALEVPASENYGIKFASGIYEYKFEVTPQDIGTSFSLFTCNVKGENPTYTGDSSWIPSVELKIGKMTMVQGTDFRVNASSNEVGPVDLIIEGIGNLSGSHTITNALRIIPTQNSWKELPSINPWSYGYYDRQINSIVAMPEHLDNVNDILFRVVDADGNEIDGLNNIHYIVEIDETTNEENWLVSTAVAEKLAQLHVGHYRLMVSVYGYNVGDMTEKRNYQPLEERGVDFYITKGYNSWNEGDLPTIDSWVQGKLASTDGLISASARFGEVELLIYDSKTDKPIYSNMQRYAGTEISDINLLKKLKAGTYSLTAVVEGTDDYTGLNSTIFFKVTPNRLPTWAVILIVAGSLGVVALVFSILHQKGVLQMLTGKVIISMRTRANVDATLAAIRAAKVAREAEASIAAAKAREAEEAAKAEKEASDKASKEDK